MALAQPEPQRLLFLFAGSELPGDASAEQRSRFEAGEGGALTPLMCVDKSPDELAGFEALVAESRQAGPPWQVVFVAALAGQGGKAPAPQRVELALNKMVDAVRSGQVQGFAAFDGKGNVLSFE
jgi:hypothetical protein